MKSTLLSILFIGLIYSSFSQAKIEFSEQSFNFGDIKEGDNAVHEFEFTNIGSEPLVISNVKASCGCTTPYWTKNPVAPGEKGKITASYNSKNRPGNFHKSITITSNAENEPKKVVYIKGVVKKEIKVYTPEEIAASPVLAFEKSSFQLGKVEKGQTIPIALNIKNEGKSPLNIDRVRSGCNCFFILPSADKTIEAGETKEIQVNFRAMREGERDHEVTISSNDITKKEGDIKFDVNVLVVDNLEGESLLKEDKGHMFK